jgi:hypothetical protein
MKVGENNDSVIFIGEKIKGISEQRGVSIPKGSQSL